MSFSFYTRNLCNTTPSMGNYATVKQIYFTVALCLQFNEYYKDEDEVSIFAFSHVSCFSPSP